MSNSFSNFMRTFEVSLDSRDVAMSLWRNAIRPSNLITSRIIPSLTLALLRRSGLSTSIVRETVQAAVPRLVFPYADCYDLRIHARSWWLDVRLLYAFMLIPDRGEFWFAFFDFLSLGKAQRLINLSCCIVSIRSMRNLSSVVWRLRTDLSAASISMYDLATCRWAYYFI